MLTLRKASERGNANHGWLNTYHTFSFANYYDPQHMGFRSLRVINEDRIAPGMGFGTHPHRDMEILTYVVEGGLAHKDSMGTSSIIHAGEVQIMSAGTGITHSEFNASSTDSVHLLQIWILPNQKSLQPRYDQKFFSEADKQDKLCLVVSPHEEDGSVLIHQDLNLYATVLNAGKQVEHPLDSNRYAWIQVVKGDILLNGQPLTAGDGVAMSEADKIVLEGKSKSEVLLFDLA